MKIQRDIRDLPVISILILVEHPAKIVNFFKLLTDPLFYEKILNSRHIFSGTREIFKEQSHSPGMGIRPKWPGSFLDKKMFLNKQRREHERERGEQT